MRDLTLKEMHHLMVVRAMRADVRERYMQQGEELAAEFPQREGVRLAAVQGEVVEGASVRTTQISLNSVLSCLAQERMKVFGST